MDSINTAAAKTQDSVKQRKRLPDDERQKLQAHISRLNELVASKDRELEEARQELEALNGAGQELLEKKRSSLSPPWESKTKSLQRRLCGQTVGVSGERRRQESMTIVIKFLVLQVGPTIALTLLFSISLIMATLWSPRMQLHWLSNAPPPTGAHGAAKEPRPPVLGELTSSLLIQSLPGTICVLFVLVHLTMIPAEGKEHSWLLCLLWVTPCVITPMASIKIVSALHLGESHWLQLLRPVYLSITGWTITYVLFTKRLSVWRALRIRCLSLSLWFAIAFAIIKLLPELARWATVPGMTATGAALSSAILFLCAAMSSQQAAARVQEFLTRVVVPLSEVRAKGPAITDWTQRHDRGRSRSRSVRFDESSTESSMPVSDEKLQRRK